MWVIQHGGAVLQLPDDAPVPPESVVVEPPSGFAEEPGSFAVRGTRIERRPDEEIERRRARREAARLTADEVARLRRALETGGL